MNKILSEEQHRLIGELCDYVEANVVPKDFDMGSYRSSRSTFDPTRFFPILPIHPNGMIQELTKETPDTNVCGTAGCMIGYAPMAHPELHKGAINWGSVSSVYCDSIDENLWMFMFGDHWGGFQNTPQGSVERIRLALEFDGYMLAHYWDYIVGDTTAELRDKMQDLVEHHIAQNVGTS
jgi:hypothetical protein